MHKGYVKGKGKGASEKFKGVPLRTFEEVQQFDSYGGVINDGVVLIDVDNMEQADILMDIVEDLQLDCQVYQTSKGMHFMFKCDVPLKCKTGTKLACGLTADIKTAGNYHALKVDGVVREIIYDINEGEEYKTKLPKWLLPISSKVDFFNMEEGEGRDSSLYSYILTLTNNGFSKEESKECIGIINKYILKDSLSQDDIERITRDDAFPEETFYDGKKFLHNNFAEFLKNNNHIKRINGQLHIYKDGVYVVGKREIESQMVHYIPSMKDSQRSEVLKYLEIICPSNMEVADARYIAFNNGIFDITTKTLSDFNPDFILTNKIPWDFDKDAYSELADSTLDNLACGDEQIRSLLEECVGYCFYRRNEMSKAFILTGSGANGKSTFLDMVKNILGSKNYSALDLEELDERFSVATLGGVLANIGDDISDGFLQGKAIANFKKIVSGNQVKAEIKNDPNIFFVKPYAKILMSANNLPRIRSGGSDAVMRRLVIIPFNANFTKDSEGYDPYITYKLKDEEVMKYVIQLGLKGLERVLNKNEFAESEKVKKELEEFETSNNPIILFLQEHDPEEFDNEPTRDVHAMYRVFCIENGFAEMTLQNFSKELKKRCNLDVKRIRIDGKLVGIYQKV